ncbi:phytoene desaturase family protein [Ethanoligenens harbinense]|uniref:4,4'-diaponeurosporene oxygenase n=1 Tax=Ethanoligenens harbinense (strain DSM 18485 / JCM 12961 / CGMCC 1.5033 / YUAN-3) TaxID=663278 RepID=E6U4H9_ETHHY|nr:NAD(P)/FAD-dependent oxidoreductase [Ethanoligenens harbinense]ADU27786.1 amine oxidase [Ethanoligenens harbinense YUAN-3]AVQ96810.1 NAD(P)/FAD-dependent oxidoreductase [Ethanoligenens harbinense YUAN-3]AYF39472.1 NAD(P)/FAD-dependent oxidoreductase [Ethanoligenens harbinense]AYF42297.1 NAD(P)/FAD-dependent oxidoreductase [Ethanoligenens harbinense]
MKKVSIVGAGISGLTAGIYALQSGFQVTIFESHTIPGGASTSWRRKGYLFEGGLHWLTGSSPEMPLHRLWRETGALDDGVQVHNRDPFFTFDYNGQTACLYRDVEKLRAHFMALSPEDKKEIDHLCTDVKKFTKMTMPVMDIRGVKVKKKASMPVSMLFGMLPALSRMPFYANQTVREYAGRFKSPLLRLLLESIIGPTYNAAGVMFTIATLASGDGGYPEGGSLGMALRMAKRFEALGGTIRYGTPVDKVIVQNDVACGVAANGENILADAVIVTQDTLAAINTLFDEPIRDPWAEKMRRTTKPMLDTFISVGVQADLSALPERVQFIPKEPLVCGGVAEPVVGICNYAGYRGYAPEGCTAVTCTIIGDSYDYWKACRENGTYQAEKEKLAEAFIAILAERYPQTAGKIAVWDVATPLTYERYLHSYKGSWMTVMGRQNTYYPAKTEHIGQFYFAGQRLRSPGGLPVAVDSGRRAVQFLCRDTGTVFQGNS